jgi:hypothetical protein
MPVVRLQTTAQANNSAKRIAANSAGTFKLGNIIGLIRQPPEIK